MGTGYMAIRMVTKFMEDSVKAILSTFWRMNESYFFSYKTNNVFKFFIQMRKNSLDDLLEDIENTIGFDDKPVY